MKTVSGTSEVVGLHGLTLVCFTAAAAGVFIERATYEVKEEDRTFRVCARVRSPYPVSENCQVDISFNITLVPTAGTAGM